MMSLSLISVSKGNAICEIKRESGTQRSEVSISRLDSASRSEAEVCTVRELPISINHR